MTLEERREEMLVHREMSALIPWYVNASIREHDRVRLESHVSACSRCRDDLAHEIEVFRSMTGDAAVEYMPSASLKKLQLRLDGIDGDVPKPTTVASARASRSMPWQGSVAASAAVMAVALGLFAINHWTPLRTRVSAPSYHTVTTSLPRARGEVIRAVFSPTVTLIELQRILDESELRIVSGPTEAGVYALAATSHRPVSESLAVLRGHSVVKFAEDAQPAAEPDNPL
jgi:hypothetical protein